jgi:antitoxin component YwqK of YwqJK toxin-antitoxin module
MNRILIFYLVMASTASAFAQIVDDAVVVEVKTNYKLFYEGEALFETTCAGCHGIHDASISVPLADIHLKHSREWLLEFLQRPQTMEFRLDQETQDYLDEYGTFNHQVFKELDEKQFNQILDFLKSEVNGPTYDKNKKMEEYFVLENNREIKVGDYKFFFPDGNLSYHYLYNNGLPWDVVSVYDRFGERRDPGTLKNGSGTIMRYDEYGNKESVTTYVRGFRSGEYKQYYDGGQLELLGFYTNGKANGAWSYFYPSGEIKNTINYQDGRILSNLEGDRPDYNPGIGINTNYGTSENPSTVYKAPEKTVETSGKARIYLYPYNEKVRWELGEANNPVYTELGNNFISMILLKQMDEVYLNATAGFQRFHPPVVIDRYVSELESYGNFDYYRLDNVGFVDVGGNQLVLMEYYLAYAYQKINMYLSYLQVNGQFKLDGWSFEVANE